MHVYGVRLTAPLAAAMVLAAACGDDSVQVPDRLLSENNVGGTAVGHVWDYIGGNAGLEPCRIDGGLFSGATDDNAMAYRRTVEGHTEHIVLGVEETHLYQAAPFRRATATATSDHTAASRYRVEHVTGSPNRVPLCG
ncbi:hypothetical protein AB3X52_13355 [Nocardioides sp. DS6]|uniref:DUF3558 domain-containing protein n=1 Tax=Nocardioides eburneus TaxID=3231482 RepID=A0ABV3T1W6_9ACTN